MEMEGTTSQGRTEMVEQQHPAASNSVPVAVPVLVEAGEQAMKKEKTLLVDDVAVPVLVEAGEQAMKKDKTLLVDDEAMPVLVEVGEQAMKKDKTLLVDDEAVPVLVEAGEQAMKKKKTLADDVATVREGDGQLPGRIGPLQNWRMSKIFRSMEYSLFDVEIVLGLVCWPYERRQSREIKLAHLRSLACRGTDGQDAANFTRCALLRFKSRETEIRLQHSPQVMENWEKHGNTDDDYDLTEELLLDAGFILEQLLRHWEAGTRPNMVMRPKQYRLELVLLPNQIPYLLLQELIQMVKFPPPPVVVAADKDRLELGIEIFLRSIAIGYMVAEQASEWLLTKYTGPVYHLLHLVYLHLTSTVEQSPLPRRRSLWSRCKALRRHAFSESARTAKKAAGQALLATAWWSYSMIPSATDLCRVGIRLRPKKGTRCLGAVCFRDGVLELPPLELKGFDCQLLINLVALELEWESSQPLFLSYAVFMAELLTTNSDMSLLRSAGILALHKTDPGPQELFFFTNLGDLNSGRELHHHFVQLARKIKTSYDHLNKRASPCARFPYLSG